MSTQSVAHVSPRVLERVGPVGLAVAATLLQGILWTLVAAALQNSLEADVAEGFVDGSAWQLSYPKHPPLTPWLTALAWEAGPMRSIVLYAIALSFGCGAFAIAALFVWRRFGSAAGLVTLLGGLISPYATYWPIKFNHDIGIMPFWGAAIITAWRAFEIGGFFDWALFGLVVGLSLWAKYAILQMVLPLAALFFLVPSWRRQIATPGPWLAVAVCLAVFAPQFVDVLRNGATTLHYAVRTQEADWPQRASWMANFLLCAVAASLPMALMAWAALGRERLAKPLRLIFDRKTMTRFDLFMHVASFSPIVVILLAGPFGVRLFYHWVTPLSVGYAIWWGSLVGRSELKEPPLKTWTVYGAVAVLTVVGFVFVRFVASQFFPAALPAYAEMDSPAFAALVQDYWKRHSSRPLADIITFEGKVAFQAAGSAAFDLPFPIAVVEDGLRENAPWFDVDDIRRNGAMLISPLPLGARVEIFGQEFEPRDVEAIRRPVLRTNKPFPTLYFATLPAAPSTVLRTVPLSR